MVDTLSYQHTSGLAIPRIKDRPFDAVVVDDATTNCVTLAVGTRKVLRRLVTVGEKTTIVAVVGKARGHGVVPAWHAI